MRKHILIIMAVILVLTLTTVAMAADPIIGTWKLNIAKSKLSQAPPKEQTESYQETEGGQIEYTYNQVRTDGSSSSFKSSFAKQGGTAKILQGGRDGISYLDTLIEPGNWYLTIVLNGKQIIVAHKTCDKDGKTMRQTVKGVDRQDKPFEDLLVFDRQ